MERNRLRFRQRRFALELPYHLQARDGRILEPVLAESPQDKDRDAARKLRSCPDLNAARPQRSSQVRLRLGCREGR